MNATERENQAKRDYHLEILRRHAEEALAADQGDQPRRDHFLARAVRNATVASEKVVHINVAEGDLQTLKDNNYALCFAKKVKDGTYNVIWSSSFKYLALNDFSWTPMYQVFGTNTFEEGIKVKATALAKDIGLGEQATLNAAGIIGDIKTGGPDTGITLYNEYGPIHPGLNQLSTGIDGEQISNPFYVAESQIVTGDIVMTPVEKILVWFEQKVVTSQIFTTARAKSVEIDMTFSNEETRRYEGGEWVK